MHMEPMLDHYNENSAIQATLQRRGNPMLALMASRAAERLAARAHDPVRVVEYGCSGGRNSVEPMRQITATLLASAPGAQLECILEDLPTNPWQQVMAESAALTSAFPESVRVLCAGVSFYNPVCANDSVDLAYSYVASHFLSDSESLASHVMMHEGTAEERRAWDARAARDWERFLTLRARELKKGGSIMISTMSRDGDGYSWREFSELVWDCIRAAERPGGLSHREVAALCIPSCLRSEAEIMRPLGAGSELGALFHVDALHFARTEIDGERSMPTAALAPLLRRRTESVWGGVFLKQLQQLGREAGSCRAIMNDVWDAFELALSRDPSRGWLDMRSFYLQLTRK
jgi:SAM dependent carboxyl methyltransferase